MLSSTKNKQTLEILRRLRRSGAPRKEDQIGEVSLDMTLPPEQLAEAEEQQPPTQEGEEEFEEATQPTPVSAPNARKRKKPSLASLSPAYPKRMS